MKRRHFGTVRKLPSGRYQAFYWREGRTVKAPQTYQAKADALGWLNGEATDIARGTWAGHIDPTLTVSDLAERWKDATPTKRRSTRKRETAILRKYIVPALGTTKLAKLTRARLQEVVDSCWSSLAWRRRPLATWPLAWRPCLITQLTLGC